MEPQNRSTDEDELPVTRGSEFADELIDELIPEDLNWRRLVKTYPLSAISMASLAGFVLGRNQGTVLLAAASAFLAREMSRNILTVLDGDGPDTADRSR